MTLKQNFQKIRKAAAEEIKNAWKCNYNKVAIISYTSSLLAFAAATYTSNTIPKNATFQQAQEITRELDRPFQINYEKDIDLETATNILNQKFSERDEQKRALEQLVNTQEYQQVVEERNKRKKTANTLIYTGTLLFLIGGGAGYIKESERIKKVEERKQKIFGKFEDNYEKTN